MMMKTDPFSILKQKVADLMKEVLALRELNMGNKSIIRRLESSQELLNEELTIAKSELSNFDKENLKTLDKVKQLRSDNRKLKKALKKYQDPSKKIASKVKGKSTIEKKKKSKNKSVKKKRPERKSLSQKIQNGIKGKLNRKKRVETKSGKSKAPSTKAKTTVRKKLVSKKAAKKVIPKKKASKKRIAETKRKIAIKPVKPTRTSKTKKEVFAIKRKKQKKDT